MADTDSELGRLAGVLNTTFSRLEGVFTRQKQFTADASHELRTPLAVMISEAQATLARDRTATEYREAVEACLETAQQMRRLTQSLLELARLDSGQEALTHRPVDLAECARAGLDLIRPLANQRSIQLEAELHPATVLGDTDHLKQVITNLLSNAVHYNREHGKIHVSTTTAEATAILTITDTGQGIASEALPHIFEHFFRADSSRSAAEGHVGLGLAIVKAIVERHGGSIRATSQPGRGTTFVVRLPALAERSP